MDSRWTTNRTRRLARWTVVALAVAMASTAGCKHRRSSYRPVFVDPEPVLLNPTPSSTTVIPTEPDFYDYGVASPAPPAGYEDTYGPYASPPSGPGPANEPELELQPLDDPLGPAPAPSQSPSNGGQTIPSDVPEPPNVFPPQTRRDDRVGAATLTGSRTDLRSRVQAIADDPIDLVQPPKADRPWRYIVLHHSAAGSGGYARLDREHRERAGLDGCSYHFVIGNGTESPDGTIEVTRRWSEQKPGSHCRDPKHPHVNEYGIGICLVGDLDATGPTPRQVEAARALVAYLQDRYEIPGDRVGTHASASSTPTVCPGANFPHDQILGRPSLASAR